STGAQVPGVFGHAFVFGVPVRVAGPDALIAGAGGMASTAHDMGIWLRFQQGALPGGDTVLSQQWREGMHRRPAPDDGLYALGWHSGPPADGGAERGAHSGGGAGTGGAPGHISDRIRV